MHHSFVISSLLVVIWLATSLSDAAVAATAEESNWPFIRGSNYNACSEEAPLADAWPEAGPPVLWTRPLGQGYSAFVAWDDFLATQYQTLGGQYVICLSAETGETQWEHRYDWPHDPAGIYPGPRATPTYYQGRLYFAAPSGLIGCLDATNGDLLWQLNVNERFGGRGTGFGYSCTPTLIADKVILPVGGPGASLVALSSADGSVLWQAGDDEASYTPAYPITFQGRNLVLGYLQNALVFHDLQTGELLWRRRLSAGYDEHSAWPIYSEPYLWLSSPFKAGCELLKMTGDSERPLERVWKNDRISNDVCSSVLFEGAIYGFDVQEAQAKAHRPTRGQFRCLDFLTGQQHWSTGNSKLRRRLEPSEADIGNRIGHATLLAADGKLFLLNDTGELILARATTSHYEELGRVSVLGGELCWTPPILSRGRLFVRNHSQAVCVYVGDPQTLQPEARAAMLTAADIPQSKYVDLAAVVLGVEPEYAFDIPDNYQLLKWFLASLLGVLGVSMLVALVAKVVLGSKLTTTGVQALFWSVAFVLGAATPTVVSHGWGEFVFTWPVSIFVAFQAAAFQIQPGCRTTDAPGSAWRARALVVFFLASCLAYFLLCRRMSLVFEWVFLCGFAAALPFTLAASLGFREKRWRLAWQALMTMLAFTGFYWSSVAVLWLKNGV